MIINATKIEILLAARGLTKKAFSDLCGISAQNISTIIKRGTCEPRTANKLAAGLGVDLMDIIEKEA